MDLRHLIFIVVYTLVSRTTAGKRSRAFYVPVIDELDLAGLGVGTSRTDLAGLGVAAALPETEPRGNPMDDFEEHVRRILADLSTTAEPDEVADQGSTAADGKQQLSIPSPSCITYPKKSDVRGSGHRKSEIRKRSRYKLSDQMKEPSGRDILSQLDDEIQEQEMDKRSRIELLSYLDAAIKNKNIELNLELRHLAKEEEILNLRDQDNVDTDKSVLALSSNIEQLNKRIKDLDERIVRMNRIKEERAAQERAIWQNTMDKSSSYNIGGVKIGDNVPVDAKKAAAMHDASKVKVAAPNVIPGINLANPGAVSGVISNPMSGPYMDPNVFAGLPDAMGASQQGAWWPMWATQQWDGMYHPKWPQYQGNQRAPPLYHFLPRQRSDISDLVEYKD